MTHRSNYWSESHLSAWLFRISGAKAKPEFATAKEWVEWRKNSKQSHILVHWFTQEFLNKLQNVIYWPYDIINNIRYYMINRFISKTHIIKTGLRPGQYHGVENKLLNGMFTELVDIIEIEKAWHHTVCDKNASKKFKRPWWAKWQLLRWSDWRCPEAGLALLEWESSLKFDDEMGVSSEEPEYGKLTQQAESAIVEKRLYDWWKITRPARKDPYDLSGWSELCKRTNPTDDIMEMLSNDKTPEEQDLSDKSLESLRLIEKQYDEEDEEMMIELVKIRKSLWT